MAQAMEGQRPSWVGPPQARYGGPAPQPPDKPKLAVLFLLDTSGSMNQRSRLGMTLLDVAKHCIEHFFNTAAARLQPFDVSYTLMSFDEDPVKAVKAQVSGKDNPGLKMLKEEISKLRASDLSNVGAALKNTFDLLNLNRLQSNVDNFGLGRCPWKLDSAVVVMLTDGGPVVGAGGVLEGVTWPPWTVQLEPFRWDQRLFSINLRMSAITQSRLPPKEDCDEPLNAQVYKEDFRTPVDTFCGWTGGQFYLARSLKEANGMVEHLISSKLRQLGVMVCFERIQGEPKVEGGLAVKLDSINPKELGQPVMLMVRHGVQAPHMQWPIPEPFWLDQDAKAEKLSLPLRHKCSITFSTIPCKWKVEEGFFDKYQLDNCLLIRCILELKSPDNVYQVFINKSYRGGGRGYPFGFLKPSSQNDCVNLFVMPYNYPVLFDLIAKLRANPNPTPRWRQDFEAYINDTPYYYVPPLRNAMKRFNVEWAFPAQADGRSPPPQLAAMLQEMRSKEKEHSERFTAQLAARQAKLQQGKLKPGGSGQGAVKRPNGAMQDDMFGKAKGQNSAEPEARNPFDTPRSQLLDTLYRITSQFFAAADGQPVLDNEEVEHEVPCSEMGAFSAAYDRAMARQEAAKFREVKEDENSGPKGIPFGNPFADDKAILASPGKKSQPDPKRPRLSPEPGIRGPRPPGPPGMRPPLSPAAPIPATPSVKPGTAPGLFGPRPPAASSRPPAPRQPGGPGPTLQPNPSAVSTAHRPMPPNSSGTGAGPAPVSTLSQPPRKRPLPPPGAGTAAAPAPQYAGWANLSKPKAQKPKDNVELKKLMLGEVKKPKQNLEYIITCLNWIEGDVPAQHAFLRDIISEAKRYKKLQLIELLEGHASSLMRQAAATGSSKE